MIDIFNLDYLNYFIENKLLFIILFYTQLRLYNL